MENSQRKNPSNRKISRRDFFLEHGKKVAVIAAAGTLGASTLLQSSVPSAHALFGGGTAGRMAMWLGSTGQNSDQIGNSSVLDNFLDISPFPLEPFVPALGRADRRWKQLFVSRPTTSHYWDYIFWDQIANRENTSDTTTGSGSITKSGFGVRLQTGTRASSTATVAWLTPNNESAVSLTDSELFIYHKLSWADTGTNLFHFELASGTFGSPGGPSNHYGIFIVESGTSSGTLWITSGDGTTGSVLQTTFLPNSGDSLRIRVVRRSVDFIGNPDNAIDVYAAKNAASIPTTPTATKGTNLPTGNGDRSRMVIAHSSANGGNNDARIMAAYVTSKIVL